MLLDIRRVSAHRHAKGHGTFFQASEQKLKLSTVKWCVSYRIYVISLANLSSCPFFFFFFWPLWNRGQTLPEMGSTSRKSLPNISSSLF